MGLRVQEVRQARPADQVPHSVASKTDVVIDDPEGMGLPERLSARWRETHPGQRLAVLDPGVSNRRHVTIWDGRGTPEPAEVERDLNDLLMELAG
jgi:hypothetical protein